MRRSSNNLSFFTSNNTQISSTENRTKNSNSTSYINQIGKMLLLTVSSLGLGWVMSGLFDSRPSKESQSSSSLANAELNTASVLVPIYLGVMFSQHGRPGYSVASLGAAGLAALPVTEGAWNPIKSIGSAFKGAGVLGNALKAIFSPADYFMPNDSIKEILEKAGNEGKQLVWEAGKEVRLTVGETGKEARATIEHVGNEANKLVANFGEQGKLLIEKAGNEFRVTADEVLKQAFAGAEVTLHIAGQEARATIEVAGQEARLSIREAGLEARLTVQETGKVLDGVVEKVGKTSNELVINMGNEGRLFITKVNEEFRFSADHVLEKTFKGSQVTLGVAGLEARLTINETGKEVREVTEKVGLELRSIITHAGKEYRAISYELPRLSRLAAESFAKGLTRGLKEELFGSNELEKVGWAMDNYMREHPDASLQVLLEFVQDQNQLKPQDKAELYTKLIEYANKPEIPFDARQKITLIIGMVALNDTKLSEYVDWQITSYTRDYTQPILRAIPNDSVREALMERDENKILGYFGLLPAPKVESDGSVPIGTIAAFPSHIVPEDYAECDGREYAVTDFPDLYAVLGTRYGYRKDSNGKEYFKIPDYRGYFLRGWKQIADENGQEILLGGVL